MTLYQHQANPTHYHLTAISIDFTFTLKKSKNQSTYRMQFFRSLEHPSRHVQCVQKCVRECVLISIERFNVCHT